jgi:hypothetical protein
MLNHLLWVIDPAARPITQELNELICRESSLEEKSLPNTATNFLEELAVLPFSSMPSTTVLIFSRWAIAMMV